MPSNHQPVPGRCLPCARGMHDWCAREKKLIGLSRECDCNHDKQEGEQQ